MRRLAFSLALLLGTAAFATAAQPPRSDWDGRGRGPDGDHPFVVAVQKPPVYLKSLTNAAERDAEAGENIQVDQVQIEETIGRVGRSFDTGRADALETCLVTGKRRIFLSLPRGEQKRGHYGPGQVVQIFDRLFQEVETRRFTYDSREIDRHQGIAMFRADWKYVVLGTDEVVTEELLFKLEKGKDDWRIFEIRAASR